ncbi:SDR family NAD(P)-dependent oxidoreductase [Quadrisphaera sp. DSM 44207]|uniref:SDR family NAD(P)-dependent oxidoreductase n=1 Tax=Quadrisphaera sp. DSM 44207 TaxID=1881057 RepID=UPI00087EE42C|nr:SDR family NAD(P)-dependent oxidoreductase [Quadrisphaera sp. DSM 44207]SDQ17165.1 short chain dehydrogenase [Quadrisphaera sp. DSM 44207]
MTTILITGATKGLGFETARRLVAAGHTVCAGSRDAERGRRAAEQLGARLVLLDVTDEASVAAAARAVEADGGLDVLVNNAGVEGRRPDGSVVGAAEATAEQARPLFETNVLGVVRVTPAFLPLLQRSSAPVVVNVSSGLASLTRVTVRAAAARYPLRVPPAPVSAHAACQAPVSTGRCGAAAAAVQERQASTASASTSRMSASGSGTQASASACTE